MMRYVRAAMGVLLVGALLAAGYYYAAYYQQPVPAKVTQATIRIGSTTLPVLLALTPTDRQRGLSGRAALAKNQGMLFVFDAPGRWGFWMKDMHFPIDIIWLDAAARVVTVAHNVSPQSYPEVLHPTQPSLYVLELAAGESQALGMFEGQQLQIEGVVAQ